MSKTYECGAGDGCWLHAVMPGFFEVDPTPGQHESMEAAADCRNRIERNEPLAKPGTVFRLPIKVEGFIEFRFPKDVRVVIDPYDYEYSGWPRVSPYGEDQEIVQIDDAPGHRRIEGDADVVDSIHVLVDRWIDHDTVWLIERGHNEEVTKGTE